MTKEFTFLQSSEKSLQAELDQVKRSYEELDQKYKRDVSGLKAQVETHEKELERERKANSERAKKDLEEINNLREDRDFIYESMTKEFTFLQISEHNLQVELDQVKRSYEELDQKYERDVSGLKAQVETHEKELERERKANSDRAKRDDLEQIYKLRYEAMSKEVQTLHQKFNKIAKDLKFNMGQYETSHSSLLQKVEKLQIKIIQETKEHLENVVLLNNMKAINATLRENTAKEIELLQEKERDAQTQLEKVKDLYQVLHFRYETDIAALKQEVEKFQQVSCERNINLERANDYLDLSNSLTDEKEDLEQKTPQEFIDFQEEKESQPDHVEVLHQEVSSEEDFSEETSSGCSQYFEMIDFAAGSIQENLDNMQDDKRKKPKLSIWKRMQNSMRFKKSKKERKE
ncbi:PREDICTED: paramyosin-like [Poecilia mexicana]|uniref:paramyosin-like n=1 Tax=Poecilia mexicana TaxID=48701 RepID=UPI00072EEB24|nr:PREDICTED: paramyosin-like [Poecilia mexicana]